LLQSRRVIAVGEGRLLLRVFESETLDYFL